MRRIVPERNKNGFAKFRMRRALAFHGKKFAGLIHDFSVLNLIEEHEVNFVSGLIEEGVTE